MSTERDADPVAQELHRLRLEVDTLRRNRAMFETMMRRERSFKLIYMAHPLGGDVGNNLVLANELLWDMRATYEFTHNIIAPWMSEANQFDDSDPEQRERGLAKCIDIIACCDELWLCGPRVSAGMQLERDFADAHGVTVLDLTDGEG